MSLADALEEFEKIDEVNEQFANGNEDFDPFKVEDSDIRPNLGNPNTWSPTRANTVFNLTEPWRTYARHKNRATKSFARSDERRAINVNMGSPIKYDAQVHDTGSSSTSSELMPLPLCIKKTRTRKPGFHGLIIPDQSILPLPLFSPSPLSPRNTPEFQTLFRAPKTSPMTAATTPVSRYKSHPSLKLAYPIENTPTKAWRSRKSLQPFINKISRESEPTSRMLSILASLSMQVDTNVSHLTTLIAETTELQRIHKANKNHRLASFWSFTPILSESQDSKADNTFNLLAGNGLNGTKSRNRVVSNGMESKQDRMARLRAEGWNTVGIKNPKRGWKGSEYYETICSEALAELYGC